MKFSRAAWNNVIIFSVILIILMINMMNDKLFPTEIPSQETSSVQALLPEHSAIVVLSILEGEHQLTVERTGTAWQIKHNKIQANFNEKRYQNAIEQLIIAWQTSTGLVQADEVYIEGLEAISVNINVANMSQTHHFELYPLTDQLLILSQQSNQWLALPSAMSKQLLLSFK